jgi:hypothetical protein
MRLLEKRFAETELALIHARFLSIDRMKKEKTLRALLGPLDRAEALPRPQRLIVVGTSVLEQSLDVDFDLLISDIAPMDLLLQRVGRLHRHTRARPAKLREALCFVTGVEDAAEWRFAQGIERVYSRHGLLDTLLLLPLSPRCVSLPDDISPLVQAAYAETDANDAAGAGRTAGPAPCAKTAAIPQEKREAYREAREAHEKTIAGKEKRAQTFRLRSPFGGDKSLLNWIDIEKKDKGGRKTKLRDAADTMRAEASVRDAADSLEVTVVQRKRNGKFHLLPWIGDADKGVARGAEISAEYVPEDAVARVAAACTVSLPMQLCNPAVIDKVIDVLERRAMEAKLDTWQESFWLEGLLPLILDEELKTEILDYTVEYCNKMGLSVMRKGEQG